MSSFIQLEKEFFKIGQKHMNFFDVLFILFCSIIPYFIKPILFSLTFFSAIGLFYIREVGKTGEQREIYEKGCKTYRSIIKEHRERLSKSNISDKRNDRTIHNRNK